MPSDIDYIVSVKNRKSSLRKHKVRIFRDFAFLIASAVFYIASHIKLHAFICLICTIAAYCIVRLIMYLLLLLDDKSVNKMERKISDLKGKSKKEDSVQEYLKLVELLDNRIYDHTIDSASCALFDRVLGFNTSNPKALICPRCKYNNGMSDTPNDIEYLCVKCKYSVQRRSK